MFQSWSLSVLAWRGAPVRLHATLAVVPFLAFTALAGTRSSGDVAQVVVLTLAVLFSLFIHELAHLVVASKFGAEPVQITLHPLGGETIFSKRFDVSQAHRVAAAGPFASALLALLLSGMEGNAGSGVVAQILPDLIYCNAILAGVNLLPISLLDGAAIWESLFVRAGVRDSGTTVARFGQLTGLLIGLSALLLGNLLLLGCAVLTVLAASEDLFKVRCIQAADKRTVQDAMVPVENLIVMNHGVSLAEATKKAVTSFQSVFPVVHRGGLLGLVFRDDILRTAFNEADDDYVAGIMERTVPAVLPDLPLGDALSAFDAQGASVFVVVRDGQFLGLLIRDLVTDFLMATTIRASRPAQDELDE